MKKNFISIILCLALIFSLTSVAFAGESSNQENLNQIELNENIVNQSQNTDRMAAPPAVYFRIEGKPSAPRRTYENKWHWGDSGDEDSTLSMDRSERVEIKISGVLKVLIKQVEATLGVSFDKSEKIRNAYSKKTPHEKGSYELQYRKKYCEWTVKQRMYKVVAGRTIKTDIVKTAKMKKSVGYDHRVVKIY